MESTDRSNFARTASSAPATDQHDLDAALLGSAQLIRDTWLFLATAFFAHAAVVINLLAVLS
jgi:hypothetical protein